MFEIRWETIVDSAHRLYEHAKKCAFLHGHSYRIRLRMGGKVGYDGMLVDFGLLKEKIHNLLDHKVILNRRDPLVEVLKNAGQRLVILDRNPSAENLALLCCSIVMQEFENVSWVEAEVFETPTQSGFVSMERGEVERVEFEVLG
jgi:6-pyruvoyltetrahydropterin/6-carboxytetrahydropterin synthase